MAGSHRPLNHLTALMIGFASLGDARAAVDTLIASMPHGQWYVASNIQDVRFDLFARYGEGASELVLGFLQAPLAMDVTRALEEALAVVESPAMAAHFAERLAVRELR